MKSSVLHFRPEQVLPTDRSVLSHQGVPPGSTVSNKTAAILLEAKELFLELADVAAVTRSVTVEQFEAVYSGEGNNHADDPLGGIYQRENHLSLFAATVGQAVADKIGELMDGGELALGCLLDSVASEAADCTAALVQEKISRPVLMESQAASDGVMRFSPGYCGWHISGQKKLFETLRPDRIDMSLNERFLMQPLKSVSGVIVIAKEEAFQFEATFAFCADCRNPSCNERYQEMLTRTYE